MDTLFLFTYAIGMFIFVTPAEKFGAKKALALAYLISSLCLFGFGFIENTTTRYIFWGMNGLAQSVTFPLYSKLLVPWLNLKQRGPMMGIWTTSQQVGGIIAYLIFGYIRGMYAGDDSASQASSIRWVYFTSGCVTAAFSVVIYHFAKQSVPESVLDSIRMENERMLTDLQDENRVNEEDDLEANLLSNQNNDVQSKRESRMSMAFDLYGGVRPSTASIRGSLMSRKSAIKLGSFAQVAAAGSHHDGNVCLLLDPVDILLPNSSSFASGIGDMTLDNRVSVMEVGNNGELANPNDVNSASGVQQAPSNSNVAVGQQQEIVVNLLQIVKSVPYLFHTSTCLFMVKLVRYMWLQWIVNYMECIGLSKSQAPMFSTFFDLGAIFGALLCGYVTTTLLKNQRALSAAIFTLLTALCIFTLSFANPDVQYDEIPSDVKGDPKYNAILLQKDGAFYFLIVCVVSIGVFLAGPDSLLGSPVPADLCELSEYGTAALGPTTGFIHGLGALGAVFQNTVIITIMGRDPIKSKYSDWKTVWYGQAGILGFGAFVFIPVIIFFLRKAKGSQSNLTVNGAAGNSASTTPVNNSKNNGGVSQGLLMPLNKDAAGNDEDFMDNNNTFGVAGLKPHHRSSSSSSSSSSSLLSPPSHHPEEEEEEVKKTEDVSITAPLIAAPHIASPVVEIEQPSTEDDLLYVPPTAQQEVKEVSENNHPQEEVDQFANPFAEKHEEEAVVEESKQEEQQQQEEKIDLDQELEVEKEEEEEEVEEETQETPVEVVLESPCDDGEVNADVVDVSAAVQDEKEQNEDQPAIQRTEEEQEADVPVQSSSNNNKGGRKSKNKGNKRK
eukprot:GDKJ01035559.1.p1 GENE.GDKJ01035559.1~~GDKJ01035559.1.p1  ORF type:complete len:890 (+),score=282.89 GDKJ01035559.1:160-2670(+)